ncbi:MAG: hypothetical protein QXX33_01210 [Candidatus Hadarchaeales archaeon]
MPAYHLDTSYLFPLLLPDIEGDKEKIRIAQKNVKILQQQKNEVRVSQVALGEFFSEVIEKIKKNMSLSLTDICQEFLQYELEIYWLKKEGNEIGRFINFVNDLRSRKGNGWEIDPMDCMIVACSMADRESFGLLTFDKNLIESRRISEIVKKHPDIKKFKITDNLV